MLAHHARCPEARRASTRPAASPWFHRASRSPRWHVHDDRAWTPYVTGSAGFGWTSLDIVEIDRVFNFQVVWGVGLRQVTRRGPGWMIEFRNHHISNAGTRGENIGINSATIAVGAQWVIR